MNDMDIQSESLDQHDVTSSQNAISMSVHNLVSRIKAQGYQSTPEDSEASQRLLKPLQSLLAQHSIKDVFRVIVVELNKDDTEILVNFLDQALDHLTVPKERARALALLSKVTVANEIFPRRLLLERVQYHPKPKAFGGSGKVYQGTDPSICVKIVLRVDSDLSAIWIREVILWAHFSHPNILPFTGMFFEDVGDFSHICFVSSFMQNGNLHDYAPRLVQKSRFPLIFDVINGIDYLHEWGIVHGDLKGQNVLISDEGRALITDFGSSRMAATATHTTASSSWTLYYVAPEVAAYGKKPTKMSDVWSFGCLCYEVLSLKPPYFQYKLDVQIVAALARNELPQRPGSVKVLQPEQDDESDDDTDQSSDDEETRIEHIEHIDDDFWILITGCCSPEPRKRLKVPKIQDALVDMLNPTPVNEEIRKRMEDLTRREAELAERETKLAQREGDIRKQENGITRKEAEFVRRESEILKKESEITRKDSDITAREDRVSSKDASLTMRETDLQRKEKGLVKRNTDIERLEKDLETKEDVLTSREADIEKRNKALGDRENQLVKREQEVFRRESDIQQREDSVRKQERNLQNQWAEAKRKVAAMKEEAEAKEAALVKREEAVKKKEEELKQWTMEEKRRTLGLKIETNDKETLYIVPENDSTAKEKELNGREKDVGVKLTKGDPEEQERYFEAPEDELEKLKKNVDGREENARVSLEFSNEERKRIEPEDWEKIKPQERGEEWRQERKRWWQQQANRHQEVRDRQKKIDREREEQEDWEKMARRSKGEGEEGRRDLRQNSILAALKM